MHDPRLDFYRGIFGWLDQSPDDDDFERAVSAKLPAFLAHAVLWLLAGIVAGVPFSIGLTWLVLMGTFSVAQRADVLLIWHLLSIFAAITFVAVLSF